MKKYRIECTHTVYDRSFMIEEAFYTVRSALDFIDGLETKYENNQGNYSYKIYELVYER